MHAILQLFYAFVFIATLCFLGYKITVWFANKIQILMLSSALFRKGLILLLVFFFLIPGLLDLYNCIKNGIIYFSPISILGCLISGFFLLMRWKRGDNFVLHAAVQNGDIEIIRLCLKNITDINFPNIEGNTPLRIAVLMNSLDIVKLLLENGADINMPAADGLAPLHDAVWIESQEMVRLLLENGADVNIRDSIGGTPLHIAAMRGHAKIVKLLLETGADAKRPG